MKFAETHNQLAKAIRTMNAAEGEARNKGLARNKDGRLSRRSKLGKDLRALIEDAQGRIQTLEGTYNYWQTLPRNRYKRLVQGYRSALGSSAGVVGFALAAYITIRGQFETLKSGLNDLMELPLRLVVNLFMWFFQSSEQAPEFWNVSNAINVLINSYLTMIIVALVGWFTAWILTRNAQYPPLVDHETLDQFYVEHRSEQVTEPSATHLQSSAHKTQQTTRHADAGVTASEFEAVSGVTDGELDFSASHEYRKSDSAALDAGADEQTLSPNAHNTDPVDKRSIPSSSSWSRLAIWSGFSGLISMFLIPIIPAIVLGHWALRKDAGKKKGLVFARIGLSLGWLSLGLFILSFFVAES